ncbi:hypothetical protein ACFU8W_42065 [Streptomyces sp. NPDC057565]|uniref:hypothetical protein n=1 Tax=Streptomyces sp. NPDC057565 TaxID=3346169 RepID=UPI0036CD9421
MPGEGPNRPLLVGDVPGRQVPRELLVAPALEHRLEDLLVWPQHRQPVDQVETSRPWCEAAVTLFADAVNAALAMRTEEADTVDGSTLVTARALTESREDRRKRRRKIWALAIGLFFFALALAVGIHGEWIIALEILLVGPFGAGIIAFGAMGADSVYRKWYLPRHGITVEAGRVGNAHVLGGRFGTYVYTDLHGVSRSVYTRSSDPTVQVAYHPNKPHFVTVCGTRSSTVGDAALAVVLLLFGLGVEGLVITLAIGAFLGRYPGY